MTDSPSASDQFPQLPKKWQAGKPGLPWSSSLQLNQAAHDRGSSSVQSSQLVPSLLSLNGKVLQHSAHRTFLLFWRGISFFFFFTEMSALTKQQQLRVEEAVGLLVRPAPTEPTEDAAAERTSSLLTHRGLRDTSLQIQWSFCTMQPFTHRHKNKWIIYTLRWGAGRTIRTTVRFRVQPSSTCRNQRSIQQHCFE